MQEAVGGIPYLHTIKAPIMKIDLRSDTVTLPSPEMLEAMLQAKLGDDVFGEDPTVRALELKTAALFGKEAGLFFPSGTMANQSAILAQTRPRQEVICDKHAHIYLYEGGGLAFHSGLSTSLIDGNRGRLTARQIDEAIRPDNLHYPVTSLVSLENTHNRGGGSIYSIDDIREIHSLCAKNGLAMHLDGSRIFNALAESDYTAAVIGHYFNTISVCLSKGLGAPIGTVVVMDAVLEKEMRKIRKVMGGGMRQAGILAAAGIYALDNNIPLLKEDHRRAKELESTLANLSWVDQVVPVDTNIVVTKLLDSYPLETLIARLSEKGIQTVAFGPQALRMVTHLNFDDDMLQYTVDTLKSFSAS
jgi:threonine aldolase